MFTGFADYARILLLSNFIGSTLLFIAPSPIKSHLKKIFGIQNNVVNSDIPLPRFFLNIHDLSLRYKLYFKHFR